MELFKSKVGWSLSILYILLSAYLIYSQGLFGESFIALILGLPWSLIPARFEFFGGNSSWLYLLVFIPIIINAKLLYILGFLIEKKRVRVLLTIVAVIVLGTAAFYFYARNNVEVSYIAPIDKQLPNNILMKEYKDEQLGIGFEYREEPNGYTLVPYEKRGGEPKELIQILSLMENDQYQRFLEDIKNEVPREGPASISIAVYENLRNLSANDWIKNNTQLSLYGSAISEPLSLAETTVGGMPAVTYKADGLYLHDVFVVGHDSKIYMISNGFTSFPDHPKADFEDFLRSMHFI